MEAGENCKMINDNDHHHEDHYHDDDHDPDRDDHDNVDDDKISGSLLTGINRNFTQGAFLHAPKHETIPSEND